MCPQHWSQTLWQFVALRTGHVCEMAIVPTHMAVMCQTLVPVCSSYLCAAVQLLTSTFLLAMCCHAGEDTLVQYWDQQCCQEIHSVQRSFGGMMSDEPTPSETCPVWMLFHCKDRENKTGLVFVTPLQTPGWPLALCPARAGTVHA